jgi:hypothetical protein
MTKNQRFLLFESWYEPTVIGASVVTELR